MSSPSPNPQLDLNLSPPSPPPPPPPSRSPIRNRNTTIDEVIEPPPSRSRIRNRNTTINEVIEPPYPWASNRHAKVDSLMSLLSRNIRTITGEVQCKKCEYRRTLEFDLETTFREIDFFIRNNRQYLYKRAPKRWMHPEYTICTNCEGPKCGLMKPVIPSDEKFINWLFLLLGQMLGCCTLDQLKYFCEHNSKHRSGAKDRVLYETYLQLYKQLDPTIPSDW